MKIETGELIKCDLRTIWPNEEYDFTPWLAEDGLSKLSKALGLDLKPIECEHRVGKYELDILAEDFNSNERVIIENQLEASDHDHLGKCLTYWGNTNAKTIIWIFKKLRDEHKKTLERLNSLLSDEIKVFAVELNVFKIDDSRPVVNFDVVVKPDNWDISTNVVTHKSGELQQTQTSFWESFITYAKAKSFPLVLNKPKDHWLNIKLNCGCKFVFGVITNSNNNTISIKIDMRTDKESVKTTFDKLYSLYEKESYTHISPNIEWNRKDDEISSNIILTKEFDIRNKDSYADIFDWILEYTEKFYNFFNTRIQTL